MRTAVQILAGVMALVAAVIVQRALGGGIGTRLIGLGLGAVMAIAAVGTFVLARKHPALVEAGTKRGEAVMPLGKLVASLGALGVVWLYNLAVLTLLVVLTIRLL